MRMLYLNTNWVNIALRYKYVIFLLYVVAISLIVCQSALSFCLLNDYWLIDWLRTHSLTHSHSRHADFQQTSQYQQFFPVTSNLTKRATQKYLPNCILCMGVKATGTLGVAGRAPKTRESRRRIGGKGVWSGEGLCPFPKNLWIFHLKIVWYGALWVCCF